MLGGCLSQYGHPGLETAPQAVSERAPWGRLGGTWAVSWGLPGLLQQGAPQGLFGDPPQTSSAYTGSQPNPKQHNIFLSLLALSFSWLQVVVTLLDPLQEGGPVAAAAVSVLEQLVVHARLLLGDKLKTLPPLPQAVEGLGKHTLSTACHINTDCCVDSVSSVWLSIVFDSCCCKVIAELAAAKPQHCKHVFFTIDAVVCSPFFNSFSVVIRC